MGAAPWAGARAVPTLSEFVAKRCTGVAGRPHTAQVLGAPVLVLNGSGFAKRKKASTAWGWVGGSVAVTSTRAPAATGTSASTEGPAPPPAHVQFAATGGSVVSFTWVAVTDTRRMAWGRLLVGVTVTVESPLPVDPGAVRRTAVKVRVVGLPAPSVAVTVMLRLPLEGTVSSTRSSAVTTPSTLMLTVIGASPPAVSTNSVACSGSSAAPVPGSPIHSPDAVRKLTERAGVPPRLTTSASKMPVTPACTPRPIQRLRTPALTASPCSPVGATKRRASGR